MWGLGHEIFYKVEKYSKYIESGDIIPWNIRNTKYWVFAVYDQIIFLGGNNWNFLIILHIKYKNNGNYHFIVFYSSLLGVEAQLWSTCRIRQERKFCTSISPYHAYYDFLSDFYLKILFHIRLNWEFFLERDKRE